MITEPTAFILGAGASSTYGFPLGKDLNNLICGWMDSDQFLRELQQVFPAEVVGQAREMAKDLHVTQTPIDRWLAQNPKYCVVAKYCIAHFIALAENPDALTTGWYSSLWERLLPEGYSRVLPEVLLENKVVFITFNYDRSLEHALMMKAGAWFQVPRDKCAEVISRIPIIHVHGQIGRLPWQEPVGSLKDLSVRPYLAKFKPEELFYHAGIKVIGETSRDTLEFDMARQRLLLAKRIHFLGFGYDEENLRRLRFDVGTDGGKMITGTHYGLFGPRKETLQGDGGKFGMPIHFDDVPEDIIHYAEKMI